MKSTALLLSLVLLSAAHAADDKKNAVDPAMEAVVQKVNATGASLLPIAAGAKTYRFTALNVARAFGDAGLDTLAAAAGKIVSLDLARTKVTDAGLAKIAGMKELKELHLEGTSIGDAGLDHLKGLTSLEYLNLYNTKVTDAGIAKLASLSKLKALYLWQSGVTKAGVAALKAKLPGAHINHGWSAEDDAKPVAAVAAAPAAPVAAKPAVVPTAKLTVTAPKATTPAAKLDAALAAKAVVYRDVIAPIMAAKCTSCHGVEKKKGKLQLHDLAAIMKGGGDGATTVIAGKPDDSLMVQRILLPTDDDDHMPPSDEPQITKEESLIISWWIKSGASGTQTIAALKPDAATESVLAAMLSKGLPKASTAKSEKPKAVPLTAAEKKQVAEVVAKMQALNASLMPLAQDTEQLRLGVINASGKFGDKELALLAPIAKQVVWVDLSRSQITDAAADTLAKMTALERLHLENTKVSDAGLAKLAGLQNLEYLNLYGDKITDAGIAHLASAKGLKKLFVWQTGVTQNGAKALQGKLSGLQVNLGLTDAEIAKLTAPPPAPPAAPAPAKKADAKGGDVIKTVMKTYHKPEDALCKKVSGGKAVDADLATLLKAYQDMSAATPPKGDKVAWAKKCQALIGAVKKIQAKDATGVAAYKAAVNCKACHTEHKSS